MDLITKVVEDNDGEKYILEYSEGTWTIRKESDSPKENLVIKVKGIWSDSFNIHTLSSGSACINLITTMGEEYTAVVNSLYQRLSRDKQSRK